MREAIGGAFTLEVIIVFMILVNSYLAFSVNYTRAFRVKNAVIDLIENYEGFPNNADLSCTSNKGTDDFSGKLCAIVRRYGYNSAEYAKGDCQGLKVPEGITNLGLCVIPHVNTRGDEELNKAYQGVYYTVYSYINIDLPILRDILPFMPNLFRITGDTNMIYSSGQENIFLG